MLRCRSVVNLPLVCLVLLALLTGAAPAAEKRIALVVGNGAYRSLPALKNPPNDAEDVAAALTSLGFEVTKGIDLDRRATEAAVAKFAKDAADADLSFFYYAGHGMQVASHNYLIPVDAKLESEADVSRDAVQLDELMNALASGKGGRVIFL